MFKDHLKCMTKTLKHCGKYLNDSACTIFQKYPDSWNILSLFRSLA